MGLSTPVSNLKVSTKRSTWDGAVSQTRSQARQKTGWTLFGLQVLAHLAVIPMALWATTEHYAMAFGVYFVTGCLGMSITFHRLLSHKSFRTHRWIEYLGSFFGTVGLTGSTIGWVAIHRAHHHHTDTPRDPHSPRIFPWLKVQCFSMFVRPQLRLVRDLIRDPFHRALHRHYLLVQILYAALIALCIEPFAVVYLYLFPAAILWHAGSAINTLGHLVGYRNFATKDESRNNPVLGLLMWGEGWHNNHHRYAKRSSFSVKWYELDLGGAIIRLIRN